MNNESNVNSTNKRGAKAWALTASLLLALQAVMAKTAAAAGNTKTLIVGSSSAVGMPMPLANISIPTLVGRVIQYVLGLTGVIALVMFIYGGIVWMTASGNQEKVSEAKKTVVWATIGLIMIFGSYALVNFVISRLNAQVGN